MPIFLFSTGVGAVVQRGTSRSEDKTARLARAVHHSEDREGSVPMACRWLDKMLLDLDVPYRSVGISFRLLPLFTDK